MKPPPTLTSTIRPPPPFTSVPHLRGAFQYAETFYFLVILLCGIFILGTCEPCSMKRLQDEVDYSACESFGKHSNPEVRMGFESDVSPEFASENAVPKQNLDNVCSQSNFFCLRSTLPGFNSSTLGVPGFQTDVGSLVGLRVNDSSASDSGSFKLYGERRMSCSLSYQDGSQLLPCHHTRSSTQEDISPCQEPFLDSGFRHFTSKDHTGKVMSDYLNSSSLHIDISPNLLDWGQQYLYFPSSAFVTVRNIHRDQTLKLYEPFTTSAQFYPCNSSDISLEPGEVALMCFVFLPTLLGSSSAQLVLRSSAGGFFIHAKGFAVESPYRIQPLVGLDVSTNGKLRNSLTLFNPFNDAISIEDLSAWIAFSSRNTSSLTSTICSVDISEVAPGKTEAIMEVDISYFIEGKILGAFCMQLLRSSKKKVDTVIIPFEAEWSHSSADDELGSPVSVSLEVLMPCDTSGTVLVAAVSVRNNVPYPLSVVKVSVLGRNWKHFNMKYIEGLILFPGKMTHVAVVTYATIVSQKAYPYETLDITNCKLLIQTNDSSSLQTEVPCRDVVSFCSIQNLYPSAEYHQGSEGVDNDDIRSKNVKVGTGSPSLIKVFDTAEADEFVMRNWKSQASFSNMSILDHHEMLFPTVQIGSHFSQWISVKNPSRQPIVMQLILNYEEIVDTCRALDRLLLPSSASSLVMNKSFAPTRYGFSIAENAVSEVFLHPYDRALLGPIIFQPSSRCVWKSSALVRNNLSGVEWLSLQGFGGSLSLVLLEGSAPVRSLDFKLNLPAPRNYSSPNFYHLSERTDACSQPSSKELHVKNTGDLPLEVRKIAVSGTDCGLDGFLVHTCKGFALEPGESTKLIMSYQTDFSAATLYRDLELALTTGILVIPMKASVSMHMFNLCKRSLFWMRVKNFMIAVFLGAATLYVIVCCILPHLTTLGSQGFLFKYGNGSTATGSHAGKSSCVQRIVKKGNKFNIASQMNESLKPIGKGEVLLLKSGQGVSKNGDASFSHVNPVPGYHNQTCSFLDTRTDSPSSVAANSAAVDRSNMQEVPQVENLRIKIGSEKRRRRRKKSSGAGLPAAFEGCSSHSGNSTPSSPLSPVTSLTARPWQLSFDGNQSCHARNSIAPADQQHEKRTEARPVSKANVSKTEISLKYGDNWYAPTQEKSTALRKTPGKPVLFPSATFPSAGRLTLDTVIDSPLLVSTSKIAPHARAPGSKLPDKRADKTEGKMLLEEKFTYDIWGDHLFGPLSGQSNDVSKKQSQAKDNNSNSFFVMGPQTLMSISQPKFVSSIDQMGY